MSLFSDEVQRFFNHNDIQNKYYQDVFNGRLFGGFAVYDFGTGERLNTGHPVSVDAKSKYFVFLITPTASVYSDIDKTLLEERSKFYMLIAGITTAIVILVLFLIKLNSILNEQINRRTKDLEESNKRLNIANEQLNINDTMQKEFINIAAHELRTPIMPILGEVEIIEEDLDPKTKTVKVEEEQIQLIIRNAKRLDRLASDILDVTKIESNSLKLEKTYFNLNDILSNSIRDIQNQVSSGDVGTKNLKIVYDPVNIRIAGDKERINQVISNLLSNALKFTEEGYIKIKVENSNDNVIISVEDTGSGIHPEIFPRLFCKFATKSDKGTGLGLYISKNIIDAHGGRIWALNNKSGIGATFFFSIPLDKKK